MKKKEESRDAQVNMASFPIMQEVSTDFGHGSMDVRSINSNWF